MNNEIIFKTKSFRKIPNPYYLSNEESMKGAEMYYIVCDIRDVPTNIPMETNPREQKLTTAVAKKIRTSLTTPGANNFYLLNRGLLLSAEKVTFNSKNETVSVVFSDTSVHGDWIYVKFLDTIFCRNLLYLNLFQFPFDKQKYFY